MRYVYKLIALVLFMLMLAFAVKNNAPVELRYYLGLSWRAPLSLVLLIVFSIGAITGMIAFLSSFIRQRRENIALQRKIKNLNPDNKP